MSDPTNPTPADDGAGRDWFRSQIAPVVEGEPIADAWSAIVARAQGGDAAAAPASAHSSSRRWLAVAAVLALLALLAGLAVFVAATRPDDATTITANEPDATGWYIPLDLPAGWHLSTAMITDGAPCDVATERWKARPEAAERDGSRPAIELSYTSCSDPERPVAGDAGPSLGPSVPTSTIGPSADDPSWEVISWEDDGHWTLTAEGVDRDRLVQAAKAIVADPAAPEAPLTGFAATGAGGGQDSDPDAEPAVAVNLVSPDGWQVQYQLVVSGDGPRLTPMTTETGHPLPQQPLVLIRRGTRPLDRSSPDRALPAGYLFGSWPGADVVVHEGVYPAKNGVDPPTAHESRDAVDALAGSLRPATTSEWRTFLATAKERPSEGLFTAVDLTDAAGQPRTSTTATASGPTTTAEGPTTTLPSTGSLESAPATVTEPTDGQPRDHYSDLTGLRVRLRLSSRTIGVTEATPAALLIENTTDHTIEINECSSPLTRWGLLPSGEHGGLPRKILKDCMGRGTPIGAGETTVVALEWGDNRGFTARVADLAGVDAGFLGTLPGGRYDAIAVMPGSTGDIRVEIPVTVLPPPCPMTDEEATRYRSTTTAEADAAATRDGRHLTAVSVDGEDRGTEWNLDCKRVRARVQDGTVIDYTFG